MRTTSKISNNNSIMYLNRNNQALQKVATQLSLEQQVVNLEDDPLSANLGIKMLNVISRSEQYNRNIKTAVGSLNLTDGYLASIKKSLDEINTLTVGAATDTTTASQRKANAIELNELLKQLVASANANDGTRYIFGGQQTTNPPYTIVNGRYVNYTGNDTRVTIGVDNGTSIGINTTGTDAFGNMTTTIPSRDMNPGVNLSTDHSTRLSDLNGGNGVPKGKIKVYYSSYPDGLEVDLSGCDTLEDVKDTIEKATLDASRNLDPAKNAWLDGTNLDWHDMQDRYVKVTLNPEGNGISLQEYDLGEPLPQPSALEQKKGLSYSGVNGYVAGQTGIATQNNPDETEVTVHNRLNYIGYQSSGGVYYNALRVDDVAQNKVAESLGIKGTAGKYDPNKKDPVLDGFIHGRDLNPVLSDRTLLADLEGYNDSTYTITNGAKPGDITISETSQDPNNVFNNWNLAGLTKGTNTGPNGELYARAVNRGTTANPEIYVEIYSCPIDKAKSSDLVATGVYNATRTGGTVTLNEANSSGVSGTVGVILPDTVKEFSVNLTANFSENLQATIHVPAFIEEEGANGQQLDVLNIASGWNIKGLDKPPAKGYDENHPASTDLDGDVSVNYRYDESTNSFIVELCRPAFNDQPAKIIASGSLNLGGNTPPLSSAVSGRVEFTGMPGFEGVSGSVYIELPSGTSFANSAASNGADGVGSDMAIKLGTNAPAGDIVLGDSTKLVADLAGNHAVDTNGATFKKGQTFQANVTLADGTVIPAGQPLTKDSTLTSPASVTVNGPLLAGTILAKGQALTNVALPAGTVIPQGSYYTSPAGTGFPVPAAVIGTGSTNAITLTYQLQDDAPQGDLVLGGAMELIDALNVGQEFTLSANTVFKKGQMFDYDIPLPGGGRIPAHTPLTEDTLVAKGTKVKTDGPILKGTVLGAGQVLKDAGPIAAGTVIPRGSYYTSTTPPGGGFPAEGMGITVAQTNPLTGLTEVTGTRQAAGYDVRATFATIEDFNRAVQEAGIYVKAGVSSDGKSLEFKSSLAGAYLTVSEDTDCYEQMGDKYQQLTGLNLNGLVKGESADKNGNVYTEVVYYPPDPQHPDKKIQLTNNNGDIVEVDAGYYVRVYSDPDQMKLPYEERDNTTMVAEGFVPSGQWNPAWDETNPTANPPFITDPTTGLHTLGFMNGLALEERNNSGVWGTVNLDYYNGASQYNEVKVDNPDGTTSTKIDFGPNNNDGITVFPGGLRPTGSRHTTIQEADIYNVTPGVTCDYTGTFHGQITKMDNTVAGTEVRLYRDSSHQHMTAKNDPDEGPVDGKFVLYEVDKYGNFMKDANDQRIVAGTIAVPADKNHLPDGETDSFTLTTGAARNYGQDREENVFSTINDILDALNSNNAEALHDLVGNITTDTTRVTGAAGDVGARVKRLNLLSERHADDILKFKSTLTSRVGMDDQALTFAIMNYQASVNALQAAMQVSGTVMQMSLLQYI